jgi:hypothetical protein
MCRPRRRRRQPIARRCWRSCAHGACRRYCVAELEADGFFRLHAPLHFVTLVTPHLGIRESGVRPPRAHLCHTCVRACASNACIFFPVCAIIQLVALCRLLRQRACLAARTAVDLMLLLSQAFVSLGASFTQTGRELALRDGSGSGASSLRDAADVARLGRQSGTDVVQSPPCLSPTGCPAAPHAL